MARCGCSGTTCSCLVTEGDNITVTGNGSVTNPYVVSASAPTLTFSDTPTLDLTRIGDDVTGIVQVDPVAGNLIAVAAGGLRVDCASVAGCVSIIPLDTATVDMTVTGTGPFTISADVNISGTAGNILTADAGGLYLDCVAVAACVAGTPLSVADTNTVDLTLSGAQQLTADVIIAPTTQNLLRSIPTGLEAFITAGCGLDGSGSPADPLIVNVQSTDWATDFACPQGNMGKIYCDPNTGGIGTAPEKFGLLSAITLSVQPGVQEVNVRGGLGLGNIIQPEFVNVVITNPDNCRPMNLLVEIGVDHMQLRVDGPGRTNVLFGATLTVSGAIAFGPSQSLGHQQWMHDSSDATADIIMDTQGSMSTRVFTLPAGGTATFRLGADITLANYNGDSQVNGWSNFMNIWGTN